MGPPRRKNPPTIPVSGPLYPTNPNDVGLGQAGSAGGSSDPQQETECATTPGGVPAGAGGAPAGKTYGDPSTGEQVTQGQGGAGRRGAIGDRLGNTIANGLKGTGLGFNVSSGTEVPGGYSSGSGRHNGRAADGQFFDAATGRTLNYNNAADAARINSAITSLSAAGIKGFGWGNNYMGGSTFHLDTVGLGGRNHLWGAGGTAANANTAQHAALRDAINAGAPADQQIGGPGGTPSAPGNNAAANCGGQNQAGCAPISAAAPAAASSMAAGAGMAPNAAMSSAMQAIGGGGLGGAQQALQGVASGGIGNFLNGAGGLANVANVADLAGGIPNIANIANVPALGKLAGVQSMIGNASGLKGIMGGAGLGGALGNVASLAGGGLGGLTKILGSGGLPSVLANGLPGQLGALTAPVQQLVQKVGADSLPGLTGVIPEALTKQLGSGLLTNAIQGAAGNILKAGVPQLGGFANILSSAGAAAGIASNLNQAINSSAGQLFGRAADSGVLGQTLDAIPGFDFSNITTTDLESDGLGGFYNEGIEGLDAVLQQTLLPAAENTKALVGPLEQTLKELVEAPSINGFGSLFLDYQSFATQGLGNITDNLVGLGNDLRNLGTLGDMRDLLNIGTAQQVARQIIENGLGYSSGLFKQLQAQGLDATAVKDPNNQEKLQKALDNIDNAAAIDAVKTTFGIDNSVVLDNLGDLTRVEKILPTSNEYNRFQSLNDITPLLALCSDNGVGRLSNFRDFGNLLSSMETLEYYPEILEEITPIRANEAAEFTNNFPNTGLFGDSPTIADFIGTAAGYIHDRTLTQIAEIYADIEDHSALADYRDLMQLLIDTLNGNYTDGSSLSISVPTVAGYAIGTHSSLDSATTAIVAAIETELQNLANTLPTSDEELWAKIQKLESLHYESASYLAHEQHMRKSYGIDIGEPRTTENFTGDGSTALFPVLDDDGENIVVTVDGAEKKPLVDFEYDIATDSILFYAAPAAGSAIAVTYDRRAIPILNNADDAWQLANSLENYALQTGYGYPSDYLRRVITNDVDGQRIQAIMMQARNRERLANVGMGCPGFNRVLNANGDSTDINFSERTGIWSDSPTRAAEIWLQLNTGMDADAYYGDRLVRNQSFIVDDLSQATQNFMQQLMFLSDNDVAITPTLINLYDINKDKFAGGTPLGLRLTLLDQNDQDGYVLGNYREIVSEIMRVENFQDSNFNVALSDDTVRYLDSIEVDIATLVGVVQRTLLSNQAALFGLAEQDMRTRFGMPSVARYLLLNIAQGV